jgi:hypothetical protein
VFSCAILQGFGHLVSIIVPGNRQVVGGVVALIFTCFSGAFPLFTTLPPSMGFATYASFVKWGSDALFMEQFSFWIGVDMLSHDGGSIPTYSGKDKVIPWTSQEHTRASFEIDCLGSKKSESYCGYLKKASTQITISNFINHQMASVSGAAQRNCFPWNPSTVAHTYTCCRF